ncbi:MAG: hypothetical protein AB7D03_03760 [Thiomicrospira sp.]
MELDYEFWRFWMGVANFAGTVMLGVYLFITQRSRVNTERIDKLENHVITSIDRHDERLTRLEERYQHAPSHEDFKRVYDLLNAQAKQIDQIAGEFKATSENVKLIQHYLLHGGKS